MNTSHLLMAGVLVFTALSGTAVLAQGTPSESADKGGAPKPEGKPLYGSAERYAECRAQVEQLAPRTSARRQFIESGIQRCKEEAKMGAPK